MELKQIIFIIAALAVVGILILRNLPVKGNRSKSQKANDERKTPRV